MSLLQLSGRLDRFDPHQLMPSRTYEVQSEHSEDQLRDSLTPRYCLPRAHHLMPNMPTSMLPFAADTDSTSLATACFLDAAGTMSMNSGSA